MLLSLDHLRGFSFRASDGKIGKIDDFFFDDRSWIIRYVVVNTGSWLSGRNVLISPVALGRPDTKNKEIPVFLTKKLVEDSPDISFEKPVSWQVEADLHQYFGWVPYWSSEYDLTGLDTAPPAVINKATEAEQKEREEVNPHLRSEIEVRSYMIEAFDGNIGKVVDYIIDEDVWQIRYFIVDTHVLLPGKKVIISTDWISDIKWIQRTVKVNLSKEQIKESPEFDPSEPVNRDFEARLYDYYGRPVYWTTERK